MNVKSLNQLKLNIIYRGNGSSNKKSIESFNFDY